MAKTKTKKTAKIKNKLILLIVPVVVVTMVVLVFIAGWVSRNSMKKMAMAQLDSSISNQGDNIEAWLQENLENFSSIKQVIEKTHPDAEGIQGILDSFYGYNKNCPNGLYIAYDDGRTFKAGASDKVFSNIKEEPWYKQGITRINMNYGAAITSAISAGMGTAAAILGDIPGAISGAVNTVQGIGDMVKGTVSTSGSTGSIIDHQTDIVLYSRFFTVADDDNANMGRPYCRISTPATLNGYMVAQKGLVQSAQATRPELDAVNAYMEGGFYFE